MSVRNRLPIALFVAFTMVVAGCNDASVVLSPPPPEALCIAVRAVVESASMTRGVFEGVSHRDMALAKSGAATAQAALDRAIMMVIAVPRFEGDEQLRTQIGALNSSLTQVDSLILDPAFEFSDDTVSRLRFFDGLSREQLLGVMVAAETAGCPTR